MFFRLVSSVGQEKILSPHEGTFAHRGARNPKLWGSIPRGDSEMFSLSHARDKTKKHLSLFFELLLSRVSFSTFPTFCSKCLTSSNLISFLIKKTRQLERICNKSAANFAKHNKTMLSFRSLTMSSVFRLAAEHTLRTLRKPRRWQQREMSGAKDLMSQTIAQYVGFKTL